MGSGYSPQKILVRLGLWLLLFGISLSGAGSASGQDSNSLIIRTVAGNGMAGFGGDGGAAVEASFDSPSAVAFDDSGNIYIADTRNHRVRKVDAQGVITTMAGSGQAGSGGDGGVATNAQLNQPLGVAVDAAGSLYIADTFNNRIRKVDPEGRISTVAGKDPGGFGGDGGPAVEALLSRPVGLIVDAEGNLFISDVFNNRVRKVDTEGTMSTVAGNGDLGFAGDGGLALNAQLARPRDIAVDRDSNLYIADMDNFRIRKVDSQGMISTVAGNGDAGFNGDGIPAVEAALNLPRSVAVDGSGRIYISDFGNHRIRRVELDGMITTAAGDGQSGFAGDGGPAADAWISGPRGVRVDMFGAILFADLDNHRVRLAQ